MIAYTEYDSLQEMPQADRQLMEAAMSGLSEEPAVKDMLGSIDNLLILVLIGAALTALVQSSSVMTSIVIAMLVVQDPLINLEQAISITMGSNIGSCVVAIMAGFSSGLNAKRTALIHLLFNVIGVVIFLIIGFVMSAATNGDLTYSSIFSGLFSATATQLAMFHTVFNVVTVIIMLPLTGLLIKLVTTILPDKKDRAIPEDDTTFTVEDDDISVEVTSVKEHRIEKTVVTKKQKAEEAPPEED